MMALSIVATLAKHEIINQDYLAMSFAEEYDSSRGYGQAMHGLLRELRPQPASWRDKSPALFRGEGSFGNGAAMRVAPLGAYFADDLGTLVEQAERSAIVTHCHAEGVAGAVAVALAAGIAAHVVPNAPPSPTDFLECICDRTPESAVRRGIQRAINLPNDVTVEGAVSALGNGVRVSAPDTVPFALWASARHLRDYADAMWTTVSALGDRDTTCAIVGGIVVMSAGIESIPEVWLQHREPLPRRTTGT
jgi:ADP-ribosylglycohydrolase